MCDDDHLLTLDFEQRLPYFKSARLKKGRVVCKFWIKGRCAGAEDCKDLHIWDVALMPACNWGTECPEPTCFYTHTAEEDKEECFNYRLGFCFEGRLCKQRHIQKTDLPEVSEMWLPGNAMLLHSNAQAARPGSTWRTSMCNNVVSPAGLGWCPYFEHCRYAHSKADLRAYVHSTGPYMASRPAPFAPFSPGGAALSAGGAPALQQQLARAPPRPAQPLSSTLPVAPVARALTEAFGAEAAGLAARERLPAAAASSPATRYFVVKSATWENLLLSLRTGEWLVSARAGEALGAALAEAAAGTPPQHASATPAAPGEPRDAGAVLLFFSILSSSHIQGCAIVTGPPVPWQGGGGGGAGSGVRLGELQGASGSAPSASPSQPHAIPIQWLRTVNLPLLRTVNLRNNLLPSAPPLPVCNRAALADAVELPMPLGRSLLLLIFVAPSENPDEEKKSGACTFTVLDAGSGAGQEALGAETFYREVWEALNDNVVAFKLSQGGGGGGAGGGAAGGGAEGGGGGGQGCWPGRCPPAPQLHPREGVLQALHGGVARGGALCATRHLHPPPQPLEDHPPASGHGGQGGARASQWPDCSAAGGLPAPQCPGHAPSHDC